MSLITVTLLNYYKIITQYEIGDIFLTLAVLELLVSLPLLRGSN